MKDTLINPILPEWMDNKDINERDDVHLSKWFNVPYIVTETNFDDDYISYVQRMGEHKGYILETENEFNIRLKENKENWFKTWSEGVRYDVRMLDGGAWDRTTNHGSFETLFLAKEKVTELMLNNIQIGDILTLKPHDSDSSSFEETVISIKNPEYHEEDFQIRTKNLDYDFTNFYSIININKTTN